MRRVAVPLLGLVLLVTLSGCSEADKEQWKRLGLPESASDRYVYMHDLWIGSWIAAGVVGVFVWGLIGWAVVRYRRRSDDELPPQVRYNLPIEVLYTIAPVVVVAVLFFFTVEKQNKMLEKVDHPDHTIVVTAQQWSWTFNYIGEQATGGENVWDSGNSATLPELWLVKDESFRFDLHSPDVIHDMWVPSFGIKLDVVPGRSNTLDLTPTRDGDFIGRCAELCGVQHSRMLFEVHIVSRDEYDAHMRQLQAQGNTGVLCGAGNSHTVAGLEEPVEGSDGSVTVCGDAEIKQGENTQAQGGKS
jgi:cytochrome c oxidase subunit II